MILIFSNQTLPPGTIIAGIQSLVEKTFKISDNLSSSLFRRSILSETVRSSLLKTISVSDYINSSLFKTEFISDDVSSSLFQIVSASDDISSFLAGTVRISDNLSSILLGNLTKIYTINSILVHGTSRAIRNDIVTHLQEVKKFQIGLGENDGTDLPEFDIDIEIPVFSAVADLPGFSGDSIEY